MTERYRFGGPIPESVKRLKARREYRASSLNATVKRGRARDREEAAATASGKDWYRAALEPFVCCIAPEASAGAAGADLSRIAPDPDTTR